ncbi:50S ribosomal protein L25/general stress protein Ctc [uncultured Methylobacterium sp.]|jgi:large subunit ribosomal protein L25|uniref:50S ribosomal protein L25/general stress protein Ctc n=1 Tax=uncultured Methylobacterium sp. TaxID=157278 RepID=UPI002633D637|nr:50S ribosomal protein L25/general stress protein Ctc [uncultured Methylobacterium sp.]
MSAVKSLEAVARDRVGKGAARAVRRQGRVPAVIYGAGQEPQAISLDANQTNHLIYGGGFLTTVFEIAVGGRKVRAIPRDYQLDPVKDFPLHVDFLRVTAGQTVEVEVPVHFANEDAAPGLKQKSGTLNIVLHTITLAVEPDAIPEALTVDLTGKDIGDAIHVSDLLLPAGASTALDAEATVATLVPPTVLGAEVEAEEAAVAEAARAESAEEKAAEAAEDAAKE